MIVDAFHFRKTIELRRGYFSSISHVDNEIGRVLDHLRIKGLENNTVILLTADHGFLLDDKDAWKKQSLFQLSAQVPLLVAGPPDLIQQGTYIYDLFIIHQHQH